MKNVQKVKQSIRIARAKRIRRRLVITDERPRLSVERTLKHMRAQIIDISGAVLVAVADTHIADVKKLKTGIARAEALGALCAERALAKKITTVVFDKGAYSYHGRVKAFADAARKGGLSF